MYVCVCVFKDRQLTSGAEHDGQNRQNMIVTCSALPCAYRYMCIRLFDMIMFIQTDV